MLLVHTIVLLSVFLINSYESVCECMPLLYSDKIKYILAPPTNSG